LSEPIILAHDDLSPLLAVTKQSQNMSELVSYFADLQLSDLGGVVPRDEVEMYEIAFQLMYILVPGFNQNTSHTVRQPELCDLHIDMISFSRLPEADYESSCLILAGSALKGRGKYSWCTKGRLSQCVALHQATSL
jgi:hypothetical protein